MFEDEEVSLIAFRMETLMPEATTGRFY